METRNQGEKTIPSIEDRTAQATMEEDITEEQLQAVEDGASQRARASSVEGQAEIDPIEENDEPQPQFPEDNPPEEENESGAVSNQFLEAIIQEQQDFLESLNQAQQQLMLDESFILMISGVANKKTDDFYNYDHRDTKVLSMVEIE